MTLSPQRLRRLVKQRERLEQLQEKELAAARRLHAVRLEALNDAASRRDRYLDAPVPARGPLDIEHLAVGAGYLLRVEREIDARRAAVTHSEADVAEELTEMLARRRDRKAMETLLDHRLEDERVERNRAD